MNYFEAKRAERALREYLELTETYWRQPTDEIRSELNQRQPEVASFTRELRIPTGFTYPVHSMMAGVTGDLLDVTGNYGDRGSTRDALNRAIGAAELQKRRGWVHLTRPWWWVVDGSGFLIRLPFLILSAAGLPPSYEQSIVAQGVKIIALLVLLYLAARFGLDLTHAIGRLP